MILYHVTYAANLPGIAAHGLIPGERSNYSGGYDGHSKGRIFLTEEDGVRYWYQRMVDLAEHNSDNPLEDLLVPIVLAVDTEDPSFYPDGLPIEEDKVGTRDALAQAWFTRTPVDTSAIYLWDGEEWVDPSDGVDPELALTTEEQWDEDEEETWVETEWSEPNPLRDIEPLDV